jgi:4-aminobutyrate aminotransferase
MTSHAELLSRHRAVLPDWLALYYAEPIALTGGQGRYVFDAEGNRYLDFFGGILTTMVGHNVPEIVEAVREQAGRMVHSSTVYLIEPMIRLAERVAELSGIPNAKVFFTNSGTEANETALLLATTARRSNQVLAMRNGFHGRSFGAIGITGNRSWSPSSLSPVQVHYVHGGDPFRSPLGRLSDADYIDASVADLRHLLATATAGDVACLIAEPIQGVGGFTVPPDGLFGRFKEVLDEHGVLFISDEVQTGWGRTGENFWGIQAHGMVPDMITFAKGLGNGLAIGGVVARAELMDSVAANSISTFGGNHLSTTAALATLDYLRDHHLQDNALKVGARLADGLRAIAARHDLVGDVRGKGLMLGVELVEPGSGTPNPAGAARVLDEARARGVLVGKGGLYGNVLRIAPPLSLTESEADQGLAMLAEAIAAASA